MGVKWSRKKKWSRKRTRGGCRRRGGEGWSGLGATQRGQELKFSLRPRQVDQGARQGAGGTGLATSPGCREQRLEGGIYGCHLWVSLLLPPGSLRLPGPAAGCLQKLPVPHRPQLIGERCLQAGTGRALPLISAPFTPWLLSCDPAHTAPLRPHPLPMLNPTPFSFWVLPCRGILHSQCFTTAPPAPNDPGDTAEAASKALALCLPPRCPRLGAGTALGAGAPRCLGTSHLPSPRREL